MYNSHTTKWAFFAPGTVSRFLGDLYTSSELYSLQIPEHKRHLEVLGRFTPRLFMILFRIAAVIGGIFFGVLTLSGCSADESRPTQEISLKAQDVVESIDGDQFLERVRAMQRYGNALYLSDRGSPSIFVLDNNFQIIRTIGRQGEGPGEFIQAPFSFHVSGNRIYGYRSGRIQVFSLEGDYLKSIPLDSKHSLSVQGLVMHKRGHLYLTPSFSRNNPYSIVKLDSSGTVLKTFGDLLETSYSERQNRQMSSRTIISVENDYLVSIGDHIPVIEKYSLEGELLQSVDLSGSPYFSERLKFIEEHYASGRPGIGHILEATEVFNSRLYVIPIEGGDSSLRVNRILEFDTESLGIVRTYTLLDLQGDPLRWVGTFEFLSENELLVFHDTEGVFYRYTLGQE